MKEKLERTYLLCSLKFYKINSSDYRHTREVVQVLLYATQLLCTHVDNATWVTTNTTVVPIFHFSVHHHSEQCACSLLCNMSISQVLKTVLQT